MVLGFFPVLFCPVSDSTFSACPPSSVDNIFSFNFMRQTQGILIPSPKPGEEKPTSGVHSQLEDLFWHSLLWNPTQITFCLNTLQAWQKGALWGESVKKPVSYKSFCKCQTSRLQTFFPPGWLLFGFKSSWFWGLQISALKAIQKGDFILLRCQTYPATVKWSCVKHCVGSNIHNWFCPNSPASGLWAAFLL